MAESAWWTAVWRWARSLLCSAGPVFLLWFYWPEHREELGLRMKLLYYLAFWSAMLVNIELVWALPVHWFRRFVIVGLFTFSTIMVAWLFYRPTAEEPSAPEPPYPLSYSVLRQNSDRSLEIIATNASDSALVLTRLAVCGNGFRGFWDPRRPEETKVVAGAREGFSTGERLPFMLDDQGKALPDSVADLVRASAGGWHITCGTRIDLELYGEVQIAPRGSTVVRTDPYPDGWQITGVEGKSLRGGNDLCPMLLWAQRDVRALLTPMCISSDR